MIDFLKLFVHVVVSPFKTRAQLEAEIILVGASVERAAPTAFQVSVTSDVEHSLPFLASVARELLRRTLHQPTFVLVHKIKALRLYNSGSCNWPSGLVQPFGDAVRG